MIRLDSLLISHISRPCAPPSLSKWICLYNREEDIADVLKTSPLVLRAFSSMAINLDYGPSPQIWRNSHGITLGKEAWEQRTSLTTYKIVRICICPGPHLVSNIEWFRFKCLLNQLSFLTWSLNIRVRYERENSSQLYQLPWNVVQMINIFDQAVFSWQKNWAYNIYSRNILHNEEHEKQNK